MNSGNSKQRWIIILLLMKIMITKTSWMKADDKCAKYIGKKCLHHRRYVYNIGRQAAQPGPIIDLSVVMKPVVGPEGPIRNPFYDPSIGFEPYWPGGEWVFVTPTSNPNVTETGLMCGDQCSPIYIRYGRICGRNKKMETRNFANYCVMRNVDCINVDGWYIAHRGKCRKDLPIYYTPSQSSTSTPLEFRINASKILAGFSERHWYLYPPTVPRFNVSTIKVN